MPFTAPFFCFQGTVPDIMRIHFMSCTFSAHPVDLRAGKDKSSFSFSCLINDTDWRQKLSKEKSCLVTSCKGRGNDKALAAICLFFGPVINRRVRPGFFLESLFFFVSGKENRETRAAMMAP